LILFIPAYHVSGGFAYPLDDTYIHAAVAQNLIESYTWGINPGEFASASSSPAWTAALTLVFSVTGLHIVTPLVLSCGFGALSIFLGARLLPPPDQSPARFHIGLAALSLLTPLPVLGGLGMEHTLHLSLVLHTAWAFERSPDRGEKVLKLLPFVMLLPLVRYESLLLVGWLGALIGRTGGWKSALFIWMAALFPVALFGFWSTQHGALPVPNSILMKSTLVDGFINNLTHNILDGAPVWSLMLAMLVIRRRPNVALFLLTAGSHLVLARVGWFYRYEAYLVGWGVLILARDFPVRSRRSILVLVPVLALGSQRAFDGLRYFPSRCVYIYDAKVVIAQVFAEMIPAGRIALHDIGAFAWYADAEIIDTAGLGTDDVAQLSHSGQFSGKTISELVNRRGGQLALSAEKWMSEDLPPDWSPVARLYWGLDGERFIDPVVVYLVGSSDRGLVSAWMGRAVQRMGGRGRAELAPNVVVDWGWQPYAGALIQAEDGCIALYTNGEVTIPPVEHGDGTLRLLATTVNGIGARVQVQSRTGLKELMIGDEVVTIPAREPGSSLTIRFLNDEQSPTEDRNLFVLPPADVRAPPPGPHPVSHDIDSRRRQ